MAPAPCARARGRPHGRLGDAEGVLVAPLGSTPGMQPPPTVMLVGPAELIARMERCSVIAWPERRPTPAYDRLTVQRDRDRAAFLLDPMGLRWLPSLALNELPVELAGGGQRRTVPSSLFVALDRALVVSLRGA